MTATLLKHVAVKTNSSLKLANVVYVHFVQKVDVNWLFLLSTILVLIVISLQLITSATFVAYFSCVYCVFYALSCVGCVRTLRALRWN